MPSIHDHHITAEIIERSGKRLSGLKDMLRLALDVGARGRPQDGEKIGRAEALNTALSKACDYAFCLAVTDPTPGDQSAIGQSLQAGARAAAAMFAAARATTGTVEVALGRLDDRGMYLHGTARLAATGPANWAHAGNWRRGFYLAIVCRDSEAADVLCDVPIDVLRKAPGIQTHPASLFWIEALQSYWKEDAARTGASIAEALKSADPSAIPASFRPYMVDILLPEIELFYRFLRGDEPAFARALQHALERHRAYWSDNEREYDSDGFFALGPAAIASLANDAGNTITVTSDYLPIWLYDGTCGERPASAGSA